MRSWRLGWVCSASMFEKDAGWRSRIDLMGVTGEHRGDGKQQAVCFQVDGGERDRDIVVSFLSAYSPSGSHSKTASQPNHECNMQNKAETCNGGNYPKNMRNTPEKR